LADVRPLASYQFAYSSQLELGIFFLPRFALVETGGGSFLHHWLRRLFEREENADLGALALDCAAQVEHILHAHAAAFD